MFQQAKLQVKTQVFSVENIIHIYIYPIKSHILAASCHTNPVFIPTN